MMMDLSSGATPTRRARIDREAATALLGNAINFPGMYLDKAWKPRDLGDDFRRPVSSDVPTLIFVGDLDPRTPIENAREVASTLSRATTVVVENATHQFSTIRPRCSTPVPRRCGWAISLATPAPSWSGFPSGAPTTPSTSASSGSTASATR